MLPLQTSASFEANMLGLGEHQLLYLPSLTCLSLIHALTSESINGQKNLLTLNLSDIHLSTFTGQPLMRATYQRFEIGKKLWIGLPGTGRVHDLNTGDPQASQ